MRTTTQQKPVEKQEDKRSEEQARAQLDSIKLMVERLKHTRECSNSADCQLDDATIKGGCGIYHKEGHVTHGQPATQAQRDQYHDAEAAREVIEQDALSVQVRSGWYNPGSEDNQPEEYTILLCTGGPACRIRGQLDEGLQPSSATIEHQDWFTPWTEYRVDGEEESALIAYAQCFYFGE